MLVNVAPHLSGYPSPYPLLLCEDALLYLLARVFRLPFPGLRGQVVHQSVDRAAELRAPPHRQADDLAYALERVRDPVFAALEFQRSRSGSTIRCRHSESA